MSILLNIYEQLSLLRIKIPRLLDAQKELNQKKSQIPFGNLSKEQKKEVEKYWGKLRPNQLYLSLYNAFNEKFDPRYIPDDMYYCDIDTCFNNGTDCTAMDDKNFYDLYFPDVKRPKTLARRCHDIFLNKEYDIISKGEVVDRCIDAGNIVIKKSYKSDGGHNVYFWNKSESVDSLMRYLNECEHYVIQEYVEQHPVIAKIHPSSLNTIRILSFIFNGQVHILSAIVRMGANGAMVDNGHSGGIFVGLDDRGYFKDIAYSYMDGRKYTQKHPTTGVQFRDCYVPNYNECMNLVKSLAPRLSRVSRLTSWDLTVNANGEPILIEVNMSYGALFFHQITNGPVFGELTKDVLSYVFK